MIIIISVNCERETILSLIISIFEAVHNTVELYLYYQSGTTTGDNRASSRTVSHVVIAIQLARLEGFS